MPLKFSPSIPKNTKRLTFRLLTLDDVKSWKAFVLSEKAMEFFTFPREESESKKWIDRQMKRYEEGTGGLMAVCLKETGQLIGQCGLLVQELEGEEVLEVGYSFLPEFWGNGYASEAAAAFYKLGSELKISDCIYSIIHVDNLASQNVAKRNGLKLWKETIWKELPVQLWSTKFNTD